MKDRRVTFALHIIVALLDVLLLSGALILQYYADKKMGVMRYLVFMRYELEKGWFNLYLMKLYTISLEVGFIICLGVLVFSIRKKKDRVIIWASALAMVANVIGYILVTTHIASDLKAYHFILTAILSIAFLQLLVLVYHLLGGIGPRAVTRRRSE
jgi:peptidoglycan/LPS O-acetylase OafA/YrhL